MPSEVIKHTTTTVETRLYRPLEDSPHTRLRLAFADVTTGEFLVRADVDSYYLDDLIRALRRAQDFLKNPKHGKHTLEGYDMVAQNGNGEVT